MRTPDGGYLVHRRQRELRVVGDVLDRKIALHEGPGQAAKAYDDEKELTERRGPCDRHHCLIVPMRADERQNPLTDASDSARISAKCPISDHCSVPLTCAAFSAACFASESATSGGM